MSVRQFQNPRRVLLHIQRLEDGIADVPPRLLDEAEEVLGVMLPAHKYAALPLDPGEEAFYQPPSGVSPNSPPVLRRGFAAV